MAFSIVFTKIKALFLFFINLFRRALCCFRRRRRPSCDSVPLTHVGVVPHQDSVINDAQSWTEWTSKPESFEDYKTRAIQDQIELYRKQKMGARQIREESPTEQEDFFGDMTPRITKQKKVFLNSENDANAKLTRLAMDPDNLTVQGGELGEWEESSGWEGDTLDWAAREALLEKKRQQREKRIREQQQKRQEKSSRPVALGARLS